MMNLFQFLGKIPNKEFSDLNISLHVDPTVLEEYELEGVDDIMLTAIKDEKYTIRYSDGYTETLDLSGGTAIDLIVEDPEEEIAKLNLQN